MKKRKSEKEKNERKKVVFKFLDLTVFEFPPNCNMSAWIDHEQLDICLIKKSNKEFIDWEDANTLGIGRLSIRAIIVPGSGKEASVLIATSPMSREEIRKQLGIQALNDTRLPYISILKDEINNGYPRTFSRGKAFTATLVQQEKPAWSVGMGVLPFINVVAANTEDEGKPDPKQYKISANNLFRKVVSGHPTTIYQKFMFTPNFSSF